MTPVEQHTAALAALAELERLAEAAGGANAIWEAHGDDENWSGFFDPNWDESKPPQADGYGVVRRADGSVLAHPEGTLLLAEARYIGAHDPAATLRVLAGRRRILERHAPGSDHMGGDLGGPWCERCRNGYGQAVAFPCGDYRDAAAGLDVELGT